MSGVEKGLNSYANMIFFLFCITLALRCMVISVEFLAIKNTFYYRTVTYKMQIIKEVQKYSVLTVGKESNKATTCSYS